MLRLILRFRLCGGQPRKRQTCNQGQGQHQSNFARRQNIPREPPHRLPPTRETNQHLWSRANAADIPERPLLFHIEYT